MNRKAKTLLLLSCTVPVSARAEFLAAQRDPAHHVAVLTSQSGLITLEMSSGETLRRIELTGTLISPEEYPIRQPVISVAYHDAERLWIVSRLGHRLSAAVLYDLRAEEIVRVLYGQSFLISPDGAHVAYVFPSGFRDSAQAVFVDEVMVYPALAGDMAASQVDGPRQRVTGRHFTQLTPRASHFVRRVQDLAWRDSGTLEVTIEETNGTEAALVALTVTTGGEPVATAVGPSGRQEVADGLISTPASIEVQRDQVDLR